MPTGVARLLVATLAVGALVVAPGGLAGAAGASAAQPADRSVASAARSLSSALLADGALGARAGSFDARGYQVEVAADGSPRFVPPRPAAAAGAVTSRAGWDARFSSPGLDGNGASTVDVVTVSGGSVYLGGYISRLPGGTGRPGGNIVRWDGRNWSSLGSGTNGTVRAISVYGSSVYAGGTFTSAGGVAAQMLARFDGTRWHDVGGGVTEKYYYDTSPNVSALAATATGVYVAGAFDRAGTVAANSVAYYDGAGWQSLGAGVTNGNGNPGQASALALSGSSLYVAGTFDRAGGAASASLARWDGASWAGPAGPGVVDASGAAGRVTSLLVVGTSLYVGGRFATVDGVAAEGVARYDGTAWHGLGAVTYLGSEGLVTGLAQVGSGRVLVVGEFDSAGGATSPDAAVWNGTALESAGRGLDGAAFAAGTVGGAGGTTAFVAGSFSSAGPVRLTGLALYTPAGVWSTVGLGVDNAVTVLAGTPAGHDLWAAGPFTQAGSTVSSGLAHFDGTAWVPLPAPTSGVQALAPFGKGVFVGGAFNGVGGAPASNIAYFDGTRWQALGAGVDGAVESLLVVGNRLFVGGRFLHAGGAPADSVASWDLTTHRWSALGGNITYSNRGGSTDVPALAADGRSLFIGGTFDDLYDPASRRHLAAPYLITYDLTNTARKGFAGYSYAGSAPRAQDNGPSGPVRAMTVTTDHQLYLVGAFAAAGGRPAGGIGHYSPLSRSWSNPTGLTGSGGGTARGVQAMGTDVYVIGDFAQAGSVPAANIAHYTPAARSWAALGAGLAVGDSGQVFIGYALAQTADGLYAGGSFGVAGGQGSENIARWFTAP